MIPFTIPASPARPHSAARKALHDLDSGITALKKNEPAIALGPLTDAHTTFLREAPHYAARTHALLGRALAATGDYGLAERHGHQAITKLTNHSCADLEAAALEMLGDTTAEQGRHDEAAELYSQALALYGPDSDNGQRLNRRLERSSAAAQSASAAGALPPAMAELPSNPAPHDQAGKSLSAVTEPPTAATPENPDEPAVWEVRLGLYATEKQAQKIKERIRRLVCPDPDHAPPCAIPWTTALLPESALDDAEVYAELKEQARIEGR